MKMYVEPLKVAHTPPRTGRAAIAAAMRTEFERTGVWALMRKKIAASIYTQPGDPHEDRLRLPTPKVSIKMFHAVSLAADVEAAKVLAFSAPRLHEGVQRVENATLELTAVVEPLQHGLDPERIRDRASATASASPPWRANRSASSPSADLARAAETARLDLRL